MHSLYSQTVHSNCTFKLYIQMPTAFDRTCSPVSQSMVLACLQYFWLDGPELAAWRDCLLLFGLASLMEAHLFPNLELWALPVHFALHVVLQLIMASFPS